MLFTHVEIDGFLLIWTFGGKVQKEPRQDKTSITNPVLEGILLIIIIIFILNLKGAKYKMKLLKSSVHENNYRQK